MYPSIFTRFVQRQSFQKNLLAHFKSLGIEAYPRVWIAKKYGSRESDSKVISIQLAGLDVRMTEISSIEIWHQTRKSRETRVTFDEIRYIIRLKEGITMRRIPILSSAVITNTNEKNTFQWDGFSWGKLPLLIERLNTDEDLNRRLKIFFDTTTLNELRIRSLSDNKVDIISDYDAQNLPSRELLNCIEKIASHIVAYVSEGNKLRDYSEEMTRVKLFGDDSR